MLLRSVRLSAMAGLSTAGAIALSSGLLIASGWLPANGGATAAIFAEGLVAAALVLWQLRIAATEISAGAATDTAAWTARNRTLQPGIASLMLVIVSNSAAKAAALAAIVAAVAATWSCFVVVPRLIAGTPVPEKTVMRFNRTQELFQRAVSPVEFLLEPRWALSASGIAVILFALIALDRVPASDGHVAFALLEIWNVPTIVFAATALAIFVIGAVWTRSWRKALGTAIAAIWAGTFAGWFAFRTGLLDPLSFPVSSIATTGSAVVAGLLFLFGSVSAGKVRDGREAQQAMTIALAESAGAVICIAFAALLAGALTLSPAGVCLSLAAVPAALVLLPCFYVALNALFPRYRSADEVFGRE